MYCRFNNSLSTYDKILVFFPCCLKNIFREKFGTSLIFVIEQLTDQPWDGILYL